jgi:hypothetical protein
VRPSEGEGCWGNASRATALHPVRLRLRLRLRLRMRMRMRMRLKARVRVLTP